MIRRPPRSTLFPYTTALPIFAEKVSSATAASLSLAGAQPRLVQRVPDARDGDLAAQRVLGQDGRGSLDRKSTRLNSSHANISYAVFCLKKKYTTLPSLSFCFI